jgi:hypothetical protein
MKISHLFHPVRSARLMRDRVTQYSALRSAVDFSQKKYGHDPRYCLEHVPDGFAERLTEDGDDTVLLERICTAYLKAMTRQPASEAFTATSWWRLVAAGSLGPVTQVLASRDLRALGQMYRNFFRDSCGAGLVGLPVNMSKFYFGPQVKSIYRRLFLGDALNQFDYWMERTGGRFAIADLASKEIGNPFGLMMEGVLVNTGAAYHHFYAQRISDLMNQSPNSKVVAEIGGGYGGMAYYFVRDNPKATYLNFDLPETIALASYYLLKSFPELKVTLYGEADLTAETIAHSDIILMPNFELSNLPSNSIQVFFSSHVLADMSPDALRFTLDEVNRTTRDYFLHVNRGQASSIVAPYLNDRGKKFHLAEELATKWHCARSPQSVEVEQLYAAVI